MTNLPASRKLPVEHLAASFNDTTNSYKFYWFLSILEYIKDNQTSLIPLNKLLTNMIANVWYPTNYFLLSFGKQDRLSQIVLKIKAENDLQIDTKKSEVISAALAHIAENSEIGREIMSLGRFVPYRFLRPFLRSQLKGIQDWKINSLIVKLAERSFHDQSNLCLYRFVEHPENGIEIQESWFKYLQEHLHILTSFCLWHLLKYLQKNNPNVPNVAGKIFEPEQRNLSQARNFWNLTLEHLGSIHCIYSHQIIQKHQFSLDHFLPWRFVTHDLLWNLVPTPRSVNSSKGDHLPNVELYFDPFAQLQYNAVKAIGNLKNARLLEDYMILFKKDLIDEIRFLTFKEFRETLHDTIVPQIQIAKNMGFPIKWSYQRL